MGSLDPGIYVPQAYPYNNIHLSAGLPWGGSLPQEQPHSQGTSWSETVSLGHPLSLQNGFLPQLTQQRQNESVRRQGLSPQGSRGSKRKQQTKDSPHDSSAMQKKAKYQTVPERIYYQHLLAKYEVDLRDPEIQSRVQADQQKWWKELNKTNPRRFRNCEETLEQKKKAWSALEVNFTPSQIETMVLGYTREQFMTRPAAEGITEQAWIRKRGHVKSLFDNLVRDQNRLWNKDDSSKRGSVRDRLTEAIAVIMLSHEFSGQDIFNMGSMQFLNLKEAAVETCRALKKLGHDEFFLSIDGLKRKNQNAHDVAIVVTRLRTDSHQFREDNVKPEESVDTNGNGKEWI
ncbi:hypothetical protein H0H93_001877 [Arthromyces matolae]|nr:hypothetical protein H0H93_001877 [Arthromyces matolae]